MSYHIYEAVPYSVDIREIVELYKLLCSYHKKITGTFTRDSDILKEWLGNLLNKEPSNKLLFRAARTLDIHKSDKDFVLSPDSIVGIGTDYPTY